jgi:Cu-Zn family superoxide dismutase
MTRSMVRGVAKRGAFGAAGLCALAATLAGCSSAGPRELGRGERSDLGSIGTAWVVTAAVCQLEPAAGSKVTGTVHLFVIDEDQGLVRLVAHVTGLEPGTAHGFHIHEYGDLTAPDLTSAGGHYAPEGHPHGGPEVPLHHAGDLGNVVADAQGVADLEMTVHGITLTGDHPVLGRAIVVHEGGDDLRTQPTGASGARLAAGVIGIARGVNAPRPETR